MLSPEGPLSRSPHRQCRPDHGRITRRLFAERFPELTVIVAEQDHVLRKGVPVVPGSRGSGAVSLFQLGVGIGTYIATGV